jgi:hypothetical protein
MHKWGMWEGKKNILNLLFVVTSFLRRHNIFFLSSKKIIWTNLKKARFNVSQTVFKQTKTPTNSYPQGEVSGSPSLHDSCQGA